jgi:hypothetical protein
MTLLSEKTMTKFVSNFLFFVLLILISQQEFSRTSSLVVAAFHIRHLVYSNSASVITLYSSKLTFSVPSYSDDWLFSFHNKCQNEKQLVTNSLEVWNQHEQQSQREILEWQESFQRNGIADFTPPMSAGLNCLMVGGDIDNANNSHHHHHHQQQADFFYDNNKLPWEDLPEADITSLRVVSSNNDPNLLLPPGEDEKSSGGMLTKSSSSTKNGMMTSTTSVSTTLISMPSTRNTIDDDMPSNSSSKKIRRRDKEASVYDCIVDQGLLSAVLINEETVRELLLEAAVALREHGIYVLVTQSLADETRSMLQSMSLDTGLEWQFELDGISDETSQVSVARRFCTGAMPKVGRLSRYQP